MITFNSILGFISICEKNRKIISIKFSKYNDECDNSNIFLLDCKKQILDFLAGKTKIIDCPFELKGTDFQLSVWNELLKIPYGKTITYKQLAERIGKPTAYRAVANANRLNPLPLIVPCHRVIGSNGKLIGYRYGIDKKKYLLDLEKLNT
jgi:methylated-DNA-[protein]-cysteine S-methyltransferase